MVVLTPDDRVLLLRNGMGEGASSWVEELGPLDVSVRHRSPDLALGPYWPGGLGVLDDGAVIVVQGRHVHRLHSDLSVERSLDLGVDAPHNSFVVLGDGSIACKDLRRPDEGPSTLHVLDPVTLEHRTAPHVLPEGSVARIAADGDELVVVGNTAVHRLRWDPAARTLTPSASPATYLVHADQSYGWDPVVTPEHVWWMDNGDHRFPNGFTLLGNGVAAGPVRLWRLDRANGGLDSTEISGLPGGVVSNPPVVDAARGQVIAYDSANAVLAAFDLRTLAKRWSVPLATAQHLVLFPDTGELLANDFVKDAGDHLAVVDVTDGKVTARVATGSPMQSVVFCTPGTRRDAYYVSLSTVARIELED